jgi:Caspase domain
VRLGAAAAETASMTRLIATIVAAISTAVLGYAGCAQAERRVALVVGNSNYMAGHMTLANPKNDAQDIAAALTSLGFETVTAFDANKREMDLTLQKFARLAADADSALFFYAGHALQYQGRNFLMPTDAELEDEISVRYQTVSIEDVRSALDRANGVKIMMLDACRNNPLAERLQKSLGNASRGAGLSRGLARVDKTQGMVVAYATAADEVAQDGRGRNSPFTAALLKRMQEPGLEIEVMLRRVSRDVNDSTGGRQRPETYISLQSEYYLNQNDRLAWERIKDPNDIAALRDFVAKHRASALAATALEQIAGLEKAAREREEFARRQREAEQRKTANAEPPRPATAAKAAEPRPPVVQQQAAVTPVPPKTATPPADTGAVIKFTEPLQSGPFPVQGQSIQKLASGFPLFPPIEGLDEKLWKHECSNCHKWDRRTLCDQGTTYARNPASVMRHPHPYGGSFKVALMEWAKAGCQ